MLATFGKCWGKTWGVTHLARAASTARPSRLPSLVRAHSSMAARHLLAASESRLCLTCDTVPRNGHQTPLHSAPHQCLDTRIWNSLQTSTDAVYCCNMHILFFPLHVSLFRLTIFLHSQRSQGLLLILQKNRKNRKDVLLHTTKMCLQ